ncbi:MAG: DUF6311 domain-containing protein [Deferribacteraceae bacterium]|jgi:hypothetical protein|nr:DUF6311 domain-containing protein [Deferribacteraceae bacterium]
MFKKKIKNIVDTNLFIFIFCSILGVIFFIKLFGMRILDFTYTNWLLAGYLSGAYSDLPGHYLGWELYRNSPWYFPVGLMDNIVYPFKETVAYTGSISLFAFPFKLLSPILPNNFQYFGLFGILAYALQGGVSGLVVKKITNSFLISAIGSLFFILSTTMIERMYFHTLLAAHFIILLCIYVCVTKKENTAVKYNILIWSGLLVIIAMIDFYQLLMVLFFMFFYMLYDLLEQKKPVRTLISLIIPSVILFSVMFSIGIFHSKAALGGFSIAGANLNVFFNPLWMNSQFLPSLPIGKQQESFAYMGFGMILCVIFAIVTILVKHKKFKIILSDKRFFRKTILTVLLVIAFLVFALSPTISFNDKVLFVYPVPDFIISLWAIFRDTGKFVWPVVYIIMFFAIWIVAKEYKHKIAIPILLCFLIIQIYDLHKSFTDRANAMVVHTKWESSLKSSAWNELAKTKKHIFYLQKWIVPRLRDVYFFTRYAIDNDMTLNDFYIARGINMQVSEYKQEELARIYRCQARDDTI